MAIWLVVLSGSGIHNVEYSGTTTLPSNDNHLIYLLRLTSSIVFYINEQDPAKVFSYDPVTDTTTELFTSTGGTSSDIASTSTKMWIRSAGDSSSVYEYNITVSPFTYSYNRTITNIPSSAGLCAINNTTLIGISNYSVYSCDITTNTSVNTFKFNFANTSRRVSGDYILTTDGHFIVLTYAASGPPNNYIEQYNWSTGVQEVEVLLSSTYRPYGLYEYDDGIYWINGDGTIYNVDLDSPWGSTLVFDLPGNVNGATQDPNYLTSSLNF